MANSFAGKKKLFHERSARIGCFSILFLTPKVCMREVYIQQKIIQQNDAYLIDRLVQSLHTKSIFKF